MPEWHCSSRNNQTRSGAADTPESAPAIPSEVLNACARSIHKTQCRISRQMSSRQSAVSYRRIVPPVLIKQRRERVDGCSHLHTDAEHFPMFSLYSATGDTWSSGELLQPWYSRIQDQLRQ